MRKLSIIAIRLSMEEQRMVVCGNVVVALSGRCFKSQPLILTIGDCTVSNRFAWDDDDEYEFNEEQEKKAEGKNLREREEHKKRERRDARWAHERSVRER